MQLQALYWKVLLLLVSILSHDQRLGAIYSDVAHASLMDGWFTHAAVVWAWVVLHSLELGHVCLSRVPT